MMWYRGTSLSLEQAKGMPIPMTSYSFGGGGESLMSFSIKSFKSSILWLRLWIISELCLIRFMNLSARESQHLELFPHPSSLLELPFPPLLERSISQPEGNHDLGTFWNWCSCIRVWKGLLPDGDVHGAKVWRGTPPLVLIHALFLNLSWLVMTPMLVIMVLMREPWSSSLVSLSLLLVVAWGSHGALKTKVNSWQK
jgi:hypothetical protein